MFCANVTSPQATSLSKHSNSQSPSGSLWTIVQLESGMLTKGWSKLSTYLVYMVPVTFLVSDICHIFGVNGACQIRQARDEVRSDIKKGINSIQHWNVYVTFYNRQNEIMMMYQGSQERWKSRWHSSCWLLILSLHSKYVLSFVGTLAQSWPLLTNWICASSPSWDNEMFTAVVKVYIELSACIA